MTIPVATAPVAPRPRHALGLPAGSVRALHTLMIVGLVCAMLLIPRRGDVIVPIPAYLVYLLFLSLGHFFAAHGNTIARAGSGLAPPLHLPSGVIRLIIFVALVGTLTYLMLTSRDQLAAQMRATVDALNDAPYMPAVILGGFFLGVAVRAVIGGNKSFWMQDIQAWLSLISTILLAVAALIHLIIEPSLEEQHLNLPTWEGILAGVIAFYFGERS
jgi:hypothetical protein